MTFTLLLKWPSYLCLLKVYIQPLEPEVLGLSKYQYEPKRNYSAAIDAQISKRQFSVYQ